MIRRANAAVEGTFGHYPSELIGQDVVGRIPDDRADETRELLRSVPRGAAALRRRRQAPRRGSVQVFEAALVAESADRFELSNELREALNRDDLAL